MIKNYEFKNFFSVYLMFYFNKNELVIKYLHESKLWGLWYTKRNPYKDGKIVDTVNINFLRDHETRILHILGTEILGLFQNDLDIIKSEARNDCWTHSCSFRKSVFLFSSHPKASDPQVWKIFWKWKCWFLSSYYLMITVICG